MSLLDILELPDPPDVTNSDARYQDTDIPLFSNPEDLQEGDIVAADGWLHLVGKGDNDCECDIKSAAARRTEIIV